MHATDISRFRRLMLVRSSGVAVVDERVGVSSHCWMDGWMNERVLTVRSAGTEGTNLCPRCLMLFRVFHGSVVMRLFELVDLYSFGRQYMLCRHRRQARAM